MCLMRPDPVPVPSPSHASAAASASTEKAAREPVGSDADAASAHTNHNAHGEPQAIPLQPPPEIHFDRGEIGDCRWMPVCMCSVLVSYAFCYAFNYGFIWRDSSCLSCVIKTLR